MDRMDRRAAVAAYKERKTAAGLYALRCSTTGAVWVGAAPDLTTIRNRLWFTLRQGGNPHRSLQAAWSAEGEAAFAFEVLEQLDEKIEGSARDRALKDKLAGWQARLSARKI